MATLPASSEATSTADAAARFQRGVPGAWVEHSAVPAAPAAPEEPASCLLLDEQLNLIGADAQVYRRTVYTAHSEAGVDQVSELHIQFNPAYETLTLHWVRLRRDGVELDALEDADIELMRHERDLYARVYRGDYLAVIQVRGLQPGDELDCAHTISGQNPVYGLGGCDFILRHTFSSRIERRLCRVLRGPGRPVEIHARGPQIAWTEIAHPGGVREQRADLSGLPATAFEFWAPSDAAPQVGAWTVTHFRSWSEVAAWSADLYADEDAEAVAPLLQTLRAAPDPVLAAIAHVQERLRYVAANYGEGGYRPRSLRRILARGYGDCKDKSHLLCALLRGLGHGASPALVDSGFPLAPLSAAPSPSAFDHVIVRAEIAGEAHWIDATANAQRGPLANRWRPHDMAALIARAGVEALEVLPPLPGGAFGESSHMLLDLRAGRGGPAFLEEESLAIGRDAEAMRRKLLSQGRAGLEKSMLEFASEQHGEAAYERFEIEDDEAENRLRIRSRLRLSDPWRPAPQGRAEFREVLCYATQLLPSIASNNRKLPLRVVEHPLRHRHTVEALLPPGLLAGGLPADVARRNAAFAFSRTQQVRGRTLRASLEVETLAAAVPAEAMLGALRDQAALQEARSLQLIFRRKWLGG